MVSTEQAVKVGKLVGARILVTGKAFPVGQQMFVTARLIGTETSLMKGVLVKAKLNGDMAELVGLLSEKVAQQLVEAGPQLVAAPDAAADPLPDLRKRLADRARPTVAVLLTERHVTQRPEARIDPAVQTQVKHMLVECGFKVIDVPTEALESAGQVQDIRDPAAWAKMLPDVEVLVLGEGFSEYATRIGNLISCAARTEIKAIRLRDGQTLFIDPLHPPRGGPGREHRRQERAAEHRAGVGRIDPGVLCQEPAGDTEGERVSRPTTGASA